MKHIFLIFVTIVSMVFGSTKANAQYVDKQIQKDTELLEETYLRRKALLASPEYQAAIREIKTGENLVIGGTVVGAVSVVALAIPTIKSIFDSADYYDFGSGDIMCLIAGGVGSAVGCIIIGLGGQMKYNGTKAKRALEIVYNLNGVKVTF